mgnify:CR=1 FL=1
MRPVSGVFTFGFKWLASQLRSSTGIASWATDNGSTKVIDKIPVLKIKKGFGEYFFSDTPLSSDENIPAVAKAEMAKKKIVKGEWIA